MAEGRWEAVQGLADQSNGMYRWRWCGNAVAVMARSHTRTLAHGQTRSDCDGRGIREGACLVVALKHLIAGLMWDQREAVVVSRAVHYHDNTTYWGKGMPLSAAIMPASRLFLRVTPTLSPRRRSPPSPPSSSPPPSPSPSPSPSRRVLFFLCLVYYSQKAHKPSTSEAPSRTPRKLCISPG